MSASSRNRFLAIALGLAASAATLAAPRDATPSPVLADSVVISDTLRLYYVGYPVGYERYQLTRGILGYRLTADHDYVDRGRRTRVTSSMRLSRDYAAEFLEVTRHTDTSSRVETRIDVRDREARVIARGETTHVALPPLSFAIAGHTPVAQHLALLRYWLTNRGATTITVVPGGPSNKVVIEARGRDTLSLEGRSVVLDRYMVHGVEWGRGSVWLDQAGRLAAFTAAGGGGLTFEAVRLELDRLYSRLMDIAAADRVAELTRMSAGVRPMASGTIAFVGATLIDGTGRSAIPGATIVVRDGRIVAAGAAGSVSIPDSAQRVNVVGKTIVPGLWDMHAHLMQIEWAPVYLAAGVTTARDMGNTLSFVVPFREAVHSGRAFGPTMLLAGLIDGGGPNAFGAVNATTPEEGRAAVRQYHELKFEQMKLYSLLKPDVVGAINAEAHRLGMTITGHVPSSLTLLAAVDSGMDQVAHLPIRGDPQSDSVRMLIAALKAHGTVVDPTASWGELGGHSTSERVANFQPGVRRLPSVLAPRIARMGANVDTATAHARLARTLSIIKMLHDAGVPVVTGTDEGVPGFSVYREIELYAAAGFTPMEALRAATAVPAKAMRLDHEVGTLEPGKRADLIVLDANPLDAIANIRTVRFVMARGVLYRSADVWKAVGFR